MKEKQFIRDGKGFLYEYEMEFKDGSWTIKLFIAKNQRLDIIDLPSIINGKSETESDFIKRILIDNALGNLN